MAQVIINNQAYAPRTNPNANRTLMEHIVEANKSSYIVFRSLQLLEKVSRAASMAFDSTSDFFKSLSGKLVGAWTWLILPRLPEVTQKAWKAITHWGAVEGPEGSVLRSHVEGIHALAEFGSSWCHAVSLVFGGPAKHVGDVCDLACNSTDLVMSAGEFNLAANHLDHIKASHADNQALIDRFSETRNEALLRLMKAIFSVAGTALGLTALYFGGPVLAPPVLLAISLASTLLALTAYGYKQTAAYQPVKFFEWAQPPVSGVCVN